MRKLLFYAMMVVLLIIIVTFYDKKGKDAAAQESIASGIIRFHVVANSDTDVDQALKHKVKAAVVKSMQTKLARAQSFSQAETILSGERDNVEREVKRVLSENGFDYSVEVMLGNAYFPLKKYGDLTFPSGNYEAFIVRLGKAKGHNWWCVMYPSLCFVDSTYQVVPEESKEKLKQTMTESDYEKLLGGNEEVSFGFKLLDWVDKLL